MRPPKSHTINPVNCSCPPASSKKITTISTTKQQPINPTKELTTNPMLNLNPMARVTLKDCSLVIVKTKLPSPKSFLTNPRRPNIFNRN